MTSQSLADRLLAAHQFARMAKLSGEEYERVLDEVMCREDRTKQSLPCNVNSETE